jgi:NADH:ubiquinone oxidoreductase subunit 6 (subunit J)
VQTDWRLLSGQDLQKAQVIQTGSVSTLASPSDISTLQQAGFTTEAQKSAAQQSGLADLLIEDYVLPFEAVSLLLLAAAIGALVLVRPR